MSSSEVMRFRTALVGGDSLLVECGELLLAKGHHIAVVGADSPRVATWATSKGLPVVEASGPAASWEAELATYEVEWLFAITHLALLPEGVLAIPSIGAVNFHDGPLPAYAGLNTPAWALLRGEQTYGVTWHLITPGIDEGDVLEQATFDVADEETALSLNTRNFAAAIETFETLVDRLADGSQTPQPQDLTAPRATFSRHDRPESLSVLRWDRSAAELDRLVRALTFGPYPNPLGFAKLVLADRVVLVTQAVLDPEVSGARGEVIVAEPDRLVVAAADGALVVTAVTDQAGVAVPLADLGLNTGQVLPGLDDATAAELTRLGELLARAEGHHLSQLQSLEPIEIPWARTPPADHRQSFATVPVTVPESLAASDDAVATSFAVVLWRLSGKDRFHLSVVDPLASASFAAAAPFLAASVPFAVTVDQGESVRAATHRLSEELGTARARPPALRELVARHPDLVAVPELAAEQALPVALALDTDAEPLPGVVVELRSSGGAWELVHDTVLVDDADARLLASCLEAVLRDLAQHPDAPVTQVDLLGADLRTRILDDWNDTEHDLPVGVAIHQLIEQQVDRTPDERALVFEDRSITYRELDERANRVAHHLIDLGVGPDDLVGVHVTRGIDLVVCVVGVHKAGGAYVPLDPLYPHDRLVHMIRDSGCRVILTDASVAAALPERDDPAITVITVDGPADRAAIEAQPATRPDVALPPNALAYCIYTSGSTGLPKGVLIEHRNAVNFFIGMDDRVAHDLPATWFAVTSLSFDISVLELLYTLTRGFTVVVHLDRERVVGDGAGTFVAQHAQQSMGFSLFYFSGDEAESSGSDKYRLLLDGARFADTHGFEAVWTPERHFHAFGGLYPQPAITGAAVAAITKNVHIRAGSVVMPLHHPIRVAEAWSIVDNISDGRVGISVASGWQPNDFVLMPQNYARAKDLMFEGIEEVKRLWRGEEVSFPGATDKPVTVKTLPRPVQPELPVWITSAGNPETYIAAGKIGANILTHLLGQSVEQLAPKLEAYRQARAESGFDPDAGKVTLMLHTYVGDDDDEVREVVREPLKEYLGTSFSLLKEYAWSFPAFQRPAGETADAGLADADFENLSEEDLDAVLEFAFLRYYETSGLFGSPDRCEAMVDSLKGIGVTEIACLVDFGISTDAVLDSLPALDRVRALNNPSSETAAEGTTFAGANGAEDPEQDQSVAAQLARHGVTHLQCTPSMARMLSMHDESRDALGQVEHLFVGGEAFPTALARDLINASRSGKVTNLYGPTETTVWSTTWPLHGDLETIPIGTPIANTRIYILDRHRQPLPPGVSGDLWIGGAGVVRGYHDRPELNAERFVADPFQGDGHRMYLTGDLARWKPTVDGSAQIEFLGRADHQVKIRGYRIELGEIETQLGRYPSVLECVAVVREDTPGDQQLVGYLSPNGGAAIEASAVKDHLRQSLPEVMIPGHIVVLDALPHTPNGKIDRNGLPTLAEVLGTRVRSTAPVEAGNDLERQVLTVWEETLGAPGIGVNDNFFDIGGHSLLAVRLHRRLRAELDRTFPLTDVYRHPTVRSFAEAMGTDTFAAVIDASKERASRRRESLQRRRARR